MIHHLTVKKASKWSRNDLDKILDEGDNIYHTLIMEGQKEEYLLVDGLPNRWKTSDLKIVKSDAGSMSCQSTEPYVTVNQAVRDMETFLFLTIKCYTMALIKEDGTYHVFDPHARDSRGLVEADGKAVLTSHSNAESLILFLNRLGSNLCEAESDYIPFEATYVNITETTDSSDSDEFDGFSEISGEYTCILQMIKEKRN